MLVIIFWKMKTLDKNSYLKPGIILRLVACCGSPPDGRAKHR